MRNKLIAALAAVALVLGGSATAAAKPYQSDTKQVTYRIGIASGVSAQTMVYFQGSSGMSWNMVNGVPWTKTVTLSEGVAPNVYFYAMVGWTKAPKYNCTIHVDGTLVVKRTVEAHQCLQSYPGQVSIQ